MLSLPFLFLSLNGRNKNKFISLEINNQIINNMDDSNKIKKVIPLIVNEKRLVERSYPNIYYGEMAFGVFDIITDSVNTINVNQKIEILVMMIYFQEHYLNAYASAVYVDSAKLNEESKKIHYLLAPYEILEDSVTMAVPDTMFLKNLNLENKKLFESVDSIMALKSIDKTYSYNSILIRYINNKEFYNRYQQYFCNVPIGRLF